MSSHHHPPGVPSNTLCASWHESKPKATGRTNLHLPACWSFQKRWKQSCSHITPYALLAFHHGKKAKATAVTTAPQHFGNGKGTPSDAKLKRQQKKPTPTKDTTVTFHHQTLNFQLFKTCAFSWSALKPGCRAVLRHRFNFCSSDPGNAIPACQKKVNERFSRPHNHVSVTFGSCELMPEIFGGYPLWSSLIHNQCPINLQEPNYNDDWPFPMHTKTQWVTAMLLALGYCHTCMHICTPSKYPMLITGCLLPFEEFFTFALLRAELPCQDLWTFCCKKFGAGSRCSFANREILLLHLLRFLFI